MSQKSLDQIKIAIVHDVLDRFGGAERVVESLLKAFPQANLFVSRDSHNQQCANLRQRLTATTFLQKLPLFDLIGKLYTPLFPVAFESLDLSDYDIVISSTAHFAKGVITKPNQLHICYCHTPPRFLYHYSTETPARNQGIFKPFTAVLDHLFRQYDFIIAQRPDYFLTNSQNTQNRIQKFYQRESTVIYPPVQIEQFKPNSNVIKEDYYLVVSRLLPYKNIETVIDAFNQLNKPLRVVGDGPVKTSLQQKAHANITFLGFQDDEKLVQTYQKAKGFILATSDEDFGITAIEALASGTPVIALKQGGAKETIIEGQTGVFYQQNNAEQLVQAVFTFESSKFHFSPSRLIEESKKYSEERFIQEIKDFVALKYQTILT